MEENTTRRTINQKFEILEQCATQLKKELVGLDEIIDQIIELITPWYIYPKFQKRSMIINLWGMTGVGKTSLVNRLVQLLSFGNKYYHFDMGDDISHDL